MNDSKKDTVDSGTAKPRRRRSGFFTATVFVLGAVAGGAAAVAIEAPAHGWGGFHGGRHGGHMRMGGTAAEAIERMQLRAAWVLGKLDATPAQREQVDEILRETVSEVFPLREAHNANRRALVAELASPTVDPAELERIRADEMALADRLSRSLVDALAEVSQVLEPEQRQKVAEVIAKRGRHGRND